MIDFALTGILKVFDNVINDLYDYTKNVLKREINKEIIMGKVPNLIGKELRNIRFVKTLWQVDRAVNVDEFYCDSHLIAPTKNGGKEKRRLINNVSDFFRNNNSKVVIKGIAGQGKSIFLRYLCIREFESGNKIPIFIELRRIQTDETLFDHISKFFETLDLTIDHELFKIIAKSGNFIFFLDAFDEIDSSITQKILNEIEQLASTSTNCPFIITTRHNSAIVMSSLFDVWNLDDLRENEYKNVINKLAESNENAKSIIQKIEAHKSSVAELLCTPLMVTLLIISYNSFQKIPEQLSEFYESIFYTLLQRHDGSKPGFTRHRRCSLNDNQYREIFNALCYETKKTRKSSYDDQTIYTLVKNSMTISGIEEDAESYLKDIIGVTCLILFEGDEYRFIHRTVQEYYAATFIKNRPENAVTKFYNACLDYSTWRMWISELSFLSEIDKFRYEKHFTLPLCRKWIGVDSDTELLDGCPAITIQRTKHIVGTIDLGWDYNDKGPKPYSVGLDHIAQIVEDRIVLKLFDLDFSALYEKMKNNEIIINKQLFLHTVEHADRMRPRITLHQIIDEGFLIKEIQNFAQIILIKIYENWKQAYEYTTKQESFDIVTDFLSK